MHGRVTFVCGGEQLERVAGGPDLHPRVPPLPEALEDSPVLLTVGKATA